MANDAYTNFLKDPDQASRRAEIAAFVGPHAVKFLKAYDDQVVTANRAPGAKIEFRFFSRGFLWPAFFLGPVWFFYRKMWVWGAVLTAIVIGLGLSPIANRLGLPLGVAFATVGGLGYLNHAVKRIEQLRARNPGMPVDAAQLAAVGGVSTTAGIVGGVVYAVLIALTIYGIVLEAKTGVPAPR